MSYFAHHNALHTANTHLVAGVFAAVLLAAVVVAMVWEQSK
jgi:heme/copper-type cytochrome/quinol oxidase subunit 4